MCIATNQPDTNSNPNLNPNHNPTTKQHAIVNIQLNTVACPTYPDKFIRDNVVAPFALLSVVIVTLPRRHWHWHSSVQSIAELILEKNKLKITLIRHQAKARQTRLITRISQKFVENVLHCDFERLKSEKERQKERFGHRARCV